MSTETPQSQRRDRSGLPELGATGSSPDTPKPLDLAATAHSTSFATLTRHSGPAANIVDFCIPCNPYFPTPTIFAQLAADLPKVLKYYPSDSSLTTKKLASILGLNPQTVAMANGSTELITWIDHLLVRDSLAIPIPTFGRWTDQPLETGKRVDMFPLQEEDGFALDLDEYAQFIRRRGSRVAVVCNPNNPDGGYLHKEEVVRFLDELADLDLIVVDESFIDFVDVEPEGSVAAEAAIRPNVIVLKSLGKNFGLHGIRFGYMVANPALTATVARALPRWNVNALAETVVHMVEDHWDDYEHSLRLLGRDRDQMRSQLESIRGLTVYPSTANFVMVKVPTGWSGTGLRDHLMTHHGVFVRECGNKLGMTSDFLRLVVRPADDVARLIAGLQDYQHSQRTARAA
ncbi:Histidinol-phosphate/aromatic aminotransferase or cobyric acid decarboxylase [Friedmanniella luteola]|uniref:Histidinol-phosphate/aromatic aminotransferase or cobyric acid decarboxylase n=1 Tax=Friedmanniella luteola TaxID=546871 RepID=A0A1H1LBW7_9ACTN|nr:histidinol-phosphate transaminase [Friedmanniella luteola]SDR71369.1 Histidinol-phosphate/aromatic aminotransferase or cobyric acid decarboxylase [Friedmanniella luteola]